MKQRYMKYLTEFKITIIKMLNELKQVMHEKKNLKKWEKKETNRNSEAKE
jgi:hypothetical protein